MAVVGMHLEEKAANVPLHAGKIQVIKIGGEVVEDDNAIRHQVRQAIHLAGNEAKVIIVHGGGVQITNALNTAGVKSEFVNGVRNTSAEAVVITQMCLDALNKKIVKIFEEEASAVNVVGYGGFDDGIINAAPLFKGTRTGKVSRVDAAKIKDRFVGPTVQFVYPICRGADGGFMNVNADDVAAAIAIAVNADRLIMCSSVPGVKNKQGDLISVLYTDEIAGLITDETITGGMIPKVQAAASVLDGTKVGGVAILDGKNPDAIERELFTNAGGGTLILKR